MIQKEREREMWGTHQEKQDGNRAMGGAFILPVNFDTFDNVGSVFRAYVDSTSSFFSTRSVSVGNFTLAVT